LKPCGQFTGACGYRVADADALYCVMGETKTERSNCRFAVEQSEGKPVLVVQLFQDTIPILKGVSFGFDLLGGMRVADAKKVAETLNEHVLDLFVKANGGS
jgi:hypothetical protein